MTTEHHYELRPSTSEKRTYEVWRIHGDDEYFFVGLRDDDDLAKLKEALESVVDRWEPTETVTV